MFEKYREYELELTDPKNLHGVEGIIQSKQGCHGNQSQSSYTCAQLEGQEVLNVVKDRFACQQQEI